MMFNVNFLKIIYKFKGCDIFGTPLVKIFEIINILRYVDIEL